VPRESRSSSSWRRPGEERKSLSSNGFEARLRPLPRLGRPRSTRAASRDVNGSAKNSPYRSFRPPPWGTICISARDASTAAESSRCGSPPRLCSLSRPCTWC
jgi:hypothetical protein